MDRSSSGLLNWDKDRPHFKLLSVLGRGQFSVVHRAYDALRQRVVALKMVCLRTIHEDKTREDCMKEIRLLKDLQHPNIVRLLCAYTSRCGTELVLALELADQGDLAGIISACRHRGGYLAPAQVTDYLRQILAAVQYLHEKRILHRDVKPSNIFLCSSQQLKLGDLGFSRFLSQSTHSVESFLGTPYYMAPERLMELKYSFPSDVWSLGCVFYEVSCTWERNSQMVALQSPFFSEHLSLHSLCKRIEMGLYPPLPNGDLYPALITKIIDDCLVPNPDLRPSINDLVQWLESAS